MEDWEPDCIVEGSPAFSVPKLSLLSSIPESTLRRWANQRVLPCVEVPQGSRSRVFFRPEHVDTARRAGLFSEQRVVVSAPEPQRAPIEELDMVALERSIDRARIATLEAELLETRLAQAVLELERVSAENKRLRAALQAVLETAL